MAATTTMASATTTASSTASATCVNVAPGKNGYLPPESCDAILYYVPSFAAAVLFCVLYGLTTGVHIGQAIVYKKGYAWVITMGALWELIAFIFRTLQTLHQNNANYDTFYTIFFLLAPVWINAFLYMTLGRMINFYLPDKRLVGISARRFGVIFVCLDIFAFIVQLAGATMTSNTDGPSSIVTDGLHIYMGGIGLQEFFILGFTALAVHLHRKLIQMERCNGRGIEKLYQGPFPWRWMFYILYFTLTLITIRIIFRIAQYGQGTNANNPVLTHEWFEYVFDAVPMFVALVALNIVYPGRNLQGPDAKFEKLSRAEKKERKMAKKMEKKNRKKLDSISSVESENVPLTPVNDHEDERNSRTAQFYGV
ncbi:uncharacterized protein N7459_005633 [Penicillium hispanicum]|uniref:uncharacterized protein n=1 Tax=Penicillium hispanicum TaxID=1080232 RepID=UPI002541FA3A|nr:uncharacterized protein N7459_005633 [Penicillium hispanicum]KAJ5579648.1 hypothetical protein N7459_005633 [Penicillium hispanicum]